MQHRHHFDLATMLRTHRLQDNGEGQLAIWWAQSSPYAGSRMAPPLPPGAPTHPCSEAPDRHFSADCPVQHEARQRAANRHSLMHRRVHAVTAASAEPRHSAMRCLERRKARLR